ncbi:MAG: hypothetical protein IH918_04070 [Acidobacteria bacterium]|nr:hypothetical protein [Acidobacteriota bacterium]
MATTVFTLVLLFMLFIIFKTFIIVPMREMVVKERLGRFSGVLGPGLHFMIPFFDRAAYRHEMREQVIDVPSQGCVTRDNIQVEVDGLSTVQDFIDAFDNHEVGSQTTEEFFSEHGRGPTSWPVWVRPPS